MVGRGERMRGSGIFVVNTRTEAILFSIVMGFASMIYIMPNIFIIAEARILSFIFLGCCAVLRLVRYMQYDKAKELKNPLF